MSTDGDLDGLPGAELVSRGLRELADPDPTESALLVLIAGPRLRRLGFIVPGRGDIPLPYEHRLYELLEEKHGAGAYSRYNSLLRRLDSLCHALERERGARAARGEIDLSPRSATGESAGRSNGEREPSR